MPIHGHRSRNAQTAIFGGTPVSNMSFGRSTSQSLLLSAAACFVGVVVSPSVAAKGMFLKTKDNSII